MSSFKTISFSDAWKEFLLIRDTIPYKISFTAKLDKNHKISGFNVHGLEIRKIDGQNYFCDDKTIPGITLVYPFEISMSELVKNLLSPILGKTLDEIPKERMQNIFNEISTRLEHRLGGQVNNELKKFVKEEKYWEALFSLHPIIEHRLRKLLKYKCMKIQVETSEIIINSIKEKFCDKEIKTFKLLTRLAFLVGAIDEKLRLQIYNFDADRDNISHNLLKMEVETHILKKSCSQGLNLMNALETAFESVIPKPNIIKMKGIKIPPLPY